MNKIILQVSGMTCSACSLGLERYLQKQEHIKEVAVNLILQTATITYESPLTKKDLMCFVEEAGFTCEKRKNKTLSWKTFLLFLLLGFLLMYVSMGPMFHLPIPDFLHKEISPIHYAWFLLLGTIPFLFYGIDILKSGIKNFLHGTSNMDTLITFGVFVNFCYSMYEFILVLMGNFDAVHSLYFESSAFILLFVKLGRLIDRDNKTKAVDTIQNLVTITPKKGTILKEDKEVQVLIHEVCVHDKVFVKPGEVFPVDGIVLEGKSHVDESLLTGESLPVLKKEKDKVFAGSINYEGTIIYEALKVGKDSMISHITKLVMSSLEKKSSIEKTADKMSRYFVPFILGVSFLVFLLHFFLHDFATAINYFVTTLVVACPCALGLATPLAMVVSVGTLSKKGVLVKNSDAIENLSKIENILLDKTGTLTTGKISVVHEHYIDKNVPLYLSSLEKNSTHPLAIAITKKYSDFVKVKDFKNHSGLGIEGRIDNQTYYAGSAAFLEKFSLKNPYQKEEKEYTQKGYMIVYFFTKKEVLGLFALRDEIKKDMVDIIKELQKDYQVSMVTGDNEVSARIIASLLGISNVYAGVSPEDKKRIAEETSPSLMMGDGINDAPALKAATVGVSVYGGSDVSADSSDIVFLKEDLSLIPYLFKVGKKTMKIIRENLFWAFFYNVIMIPLASGFLPITLNPMIASLAMTFSSITVALNSLRLKKISN